MKGLVLSLFPGIDILGRGFEEEGFCVVRGPDVLFGQDVRDFHPSFGVFDGIIGGPPCQKFSSLGQVNKARWGYEAEDLTPEFCRCVDEAQPRWFLMENVIQAPAPVVMGYQVTRRILDNHWLGETAQARRRAFSFGRRGEKAFPAWHIPVPALSPIEKVPTVTSGPNDWRGTRNINRSLGEKLQLQGLDPKMFSRHPFTARELDRMIGNAVPLPMARAVAKAVVSALNPRDGGVIRMEILGEGCH